MRNIWPFTLRGTGAVVLAVACFVLATETGISEFQYFGVLLVGVVAASLVALFLTRRADSVSRSLSTDVASVGRAATVDVRVGVRTAVPSAPGRWTDTLSRTLSGRAEGVFPALASGMRGGERAVALSYEVTGAHRGTAAIGPLSLTTTDPFGLVRRRHVIGGRTEVTVVPALVDLSPLPHGTGAAGGILHSVSHQLGQGADNLIARPYSPGDSMRRIHWRATAHRDQLMVRQEEQEQTPEATVVLDRSGSRYAPDARHAPGADPGFEAAVSACVSVVARLAREGYTVHVIDADGSALSEPIEGSDLAEIDELLVHFAGIVAAREDHLPRLAAQFTGIQTGPLVLITGTFDRSDVELVGAVAHHSSLPVLLSTAPVGTTLGRAAQAGWRTAAIGPEDDLGQAWTTAVGRGVTRVLG